MKNIYKNILSKIVNFHSEKGQLIYMGNKDFDYLSLLNDFEKELVRLMLTDNVMRYYGHSRYYFEILDELFTFDTHCRLTCKYTNYPCEILFDSHVFSFIMDVCDDLIYYYEETDNV